jgi:hypothetical protein
MRNELTGLCKIGVSKQPEQRRINVQRQLRSPIALLHTTAETPFGRKIERKIHRLLAKQRVKYEWL